MGCQQQQRQRRRHTVVVESLCLNWCRRRRWRWRRHTAMAVVPAAAAAMAAEVVAVAVAVESPWLPAAAAETAVAVAAVVATPRGGIGLLPTIGDTWQSRVTLQWHSPLVPVRSNDGGQVQHLPCGVATARRSAVVEGRGSHANASGGQMRMQLPHATGISIRNSDSISSSSCPQRRLNHHLLRFRFTST